MSDTQKSYVDMIETNLNEARGLNVKLIGALDTAHSIMKAIQEDEVLDSDGQEYVEEWHMTKVEQALAEVKA